jgi:hypothetical protein
MLYNVLRIKFLTIVITIKLTFISRQFKRVLKFNGSGVGGDQFAKC